MFDISKARDIAVSVLAGISITVAFWFGPDILDYLHAPRPATAQPEPIPDDNSPAAAVTPDAVPENSSPARDSAPVRAPDHAAVLARLRETCEFWSARASDESGRVFRDKACAEMRAYAAGTNQRVEPISRSRQPAGKSVVPDTRKSQVPVYVRECSQYQRGSIDYRRCRAAESRRLQAQCQYFRQRDEWRQAGAWCAAYESYPIID